MPQDGFVQSVLAHRCFSRATDPGAFVLEHQLAKGQGSETFAARFGLGAWCYRRCAIPRVRQPTRATRDPSSRHAQRQPATCKTATGTKQTATDRGRALAGRGMRPAQDILSDLYQRKLEEINSFQEFMYCLSRPVVKARSAGASDADAGGEPPRLAKTRSLLWPLPCSPPVSCRRLCESIAKYAQRNLKDG